MGADGRGIAFKSFGARQRGPAAAGVAYGGLFVADADFLEFGDVGDFALGILRVFDDKVRPPQASRPW